MTEALPPHRGVLILVLGIVSLLICQLLGIVPWILGRNDMRAIDSGAMDPTGRGLTQAGMVLGIISVVLAAIGVAIFAFMIITGALFATGAAMSTR
jgi:hypothetical protein